MSISPIQNNASQSVQSVSQQSGQTPQTPENKVNRAALKRILSEPMVQQSKKKKKEEVKDYVDRSVARLARRNNVWRTLVERNQEDQNPQI